VTAITIAGGVYHERCIWPDWDHIYGSGGRAAASLSGHVGKITLKAYLRPQIAKLIVPYSEIYGFSVVPVATSQIVSFEYIHSLSIPAIRPIPTRIKINKPYPVSDAVVLRFGMMEGSAIVDADRCVHDPQSAFAPEPFAQNGSKAKHLAIVANRSEVTALAGNAEPVAAAKILLKRGAEVVVVKAGTAGAFVVDRSGTTRVPAYRSDRVFTIGSGDVFAAVFAAVWGVRRRSSIEAARVASKGVAAYTGSMALPIPTVKQLSRDSVPEAKLVQRKVYLAGPFFTLGQRWLVEEARRCLLEMGLEVFSPIHDVGPGRAQDVASADLAALNSADCLFALIDGLDSGTVFEIGYARSRKKPVYALAQTVSDEDLKMILGSGCRIYDDFVTALHHLAWGL